MKEIIRNRLPYLYGICKGLYEKTAYYKNTVNNLNKLKKVTKEQRQQEENRVMIDVFDDNYIVRNGPFC